MSKKKEQEIRSFEDLKVWKKSRSLRKKIQVLTDDFPKEERYRLVDQMIRSSRSVTANIAEGYGRFHYQENIQFCRQARGSLYELLDHLICAFDKKYIDLKELQDFRKEIVRCTQLLNGYISYLQKAKKSTAKENQISYDLSPDSGMDNK